MQLWVRVLQKGEEARPDSGKGIRTEFKVLSSVAKEKTIYIGITRSCDFTLGSSVFTRPQNTDRKALINELTSLCIVQPRAS